MDPYTTEAEQIAQLKRWIKAYALPVIIGIVLASVVVFGWRYWKAEQERAALEASSYYEQMQADLIEKNAKGVIVQANYLQENYADSSYAAMAALILARNAVEENQWGEAEWQLNWVIKHTSDPALKQLAWWRLARLQLQQKQPQAALKTLAKTNKNYFAAGIESTRGDAYVALGDLKKARAAYRKAMSQLPADAPMLAFVTMKYNDILPPVTPKKG